MPFSPDTFYVRKPAEQSVCRTVLAASPFPVQPQPQPQKLKTENFPPSLDPPSHREQYLTIRLLLPSILKYWTYLRFFNPRSRNQAETTGPDDQTQQEKTPRSHPPLQFLSDHHVATITILAGHRILTLWTAATNHAIHHMHNRNLIKRKHFRSCHPRHHSAPN